MSDVMTRDVLLRLVDEWLEEGGVVAGPVRRDSGSVHFETLESSTQLVLDDFIHPANTAKEYVLPKTERLFRYRRHGNDVTLIDEPVEPAPILLVGCRPCDAAAFPILDKVMGWDYQDSQYYRRRAALTVLTLACTEWDEQCFCTSVGLGPAADRGSDALLLDLGDGSFDVRPLTDRGRAALAGRTEASDRSAPLPAGPPSQVDLAPLQEILRDGFDSPVWAKEGLRCTGCGACAFTCPTCHCFDIVDETAGDGGCRLRNWDSCQFGMFTVHASGHNPRPDQPSRQRQRLMHKFVIYPDKFDHVLCTGCGNCYRNCPVNLGVLNVLKAAAVRPSAAGGPVSRGEVT
jgi:ferredoxin